MNAIQVWECPQCHKLHDYEEDAYACCPLIDWWTCDTCSKEYVTQQEAEECCKMEE